MRSNDDLKLWIEDKIDCLAKDVSAMTEQIADLNVRLDILDGKEIANDTNTGWIRFLLGAASAVALVILSGIFVLAAGVLSRGSWHFPH